jgi:hypothetical protein
MGDRGQLAVQGLSCQRARRRDRRRGRRVGQRPARADGVAGGPAPARRAARWRSWASPSTPRREENRRLKVRSLPEEPLRNACVGDSAWPPEHGPARLRRAAPGQRRAQAAGCAGRLARTGPPAWIADYGVKTQGEGAPIRSLSGGNVQRAVLARELAGDRSMLLVSGQPGVRPGLRGGGRDPHPPDARHAPRRRGAAGQRRPGRTAGAGRPHRGDERRPHRPGGQRTGRTRT